MTPEEKIEFMDKRMESMNEGRFGHGHFFGGRGFGFCGNDEREKEINDFREKWSKMTPEEKIEFMDKRMESMNESRFSVETIDKLCEKWMKKTPEEKEAFINKRKEISRHPGMFGREDFFGRGNFGVDEEKQEND
ncbi:MAG: hypothetical protein FWF54_09520, partial [Candidatus Azobacteroides sp.]|nr:hypothetical protein [Candidatus Azobacteroides sp.]